MGIRIEGATDEEALGTGQHAEASHELHDDELDAGEQSQGAETGEEGDETAVFIGEPPSESSADSEEHQQAAPEWAKALRKDYRRVQRELADERRKNAVVPPVVQPAEKLGEPPTLEQCGWDEQEFRKQTAAHLKKEREIADRVEQQAAAVRKRQDEANARVKTYQTQQKALKVRDFTEAEDDVCASLSEVQQNLLMAGADNTALIVYALGKNPEKLAELAKITDPVRFAFAAGKLEKDIKVQPRKGNTKPQPEQIVRSTASMSGGGNSALDAARKKAEQSGDYTEVNRIKRQLKAAQARR
jgi:hypothetical protein